MLSSCVRLSVTSRYCVEWAEWIELVFGTEDSLGLSYIVLEGNSGMLKNNGTYLSGTLSKTLDLENFATARRSSQVLSTEVDSVIN